MTVEMTYELSNDVGEMELFQPADSLAGPMRRGTCPGCKQQVEGYLGASACIRFRNSAGAVEYLDGVTTNYGHFECVRALFLQLMTSDLATQRVPSTVADLTVHIGRQRDMINFAHAHPGQIVESVYYPDAPRNARYHFALKGVMK